MKYQDQVIQKEINILVEVQIVIPIVRFSIQNQMEIDLEILKFELFGKPKERGLFPMEEVDGLTQDINILGENKMNARLNEFLLDNNIIYFEEYDSVTKNIDSFGNIEKLPYKGLFQEIIGDNEKKNTILLSIEKEKEFGTWRQGDLVLVVTRVEKRLYSMFFLNHKKGLAGMEISRNLFEQFLCYIY